MEVKRRSYGGKGGIRTPGTVARTRDFQSRTFGHSVTFPGLNWVLSETLRAFEYLQCALILQVLTKSANEVSFFWKDRLRLQCKGINL